ncbi:hypothetical protein BC827DRAFT_1266733 [Russula dissimulans]|nr:hypothetical protein BC827DRAFT_1266733 [Russula dissimulans]
MEILTSLEHWSSTTATLLQTLDTKLVSLAEHNAAKACEDTEHKEALNVVLKEVAERLREKQNAIKRAASGAAGRKDGDRMDVDEPEGAPQEMVKARAKRNRM